MGYTIYYRARFIKTDSGILPVMEMGCSNVTEMRSWNGKERRARDFQILQTGSPTGNYNTPEQIFAYVESIRNEAIEMAKNEGDDRFKYSDDNFAWHVGIQLASKRNVNYKQFYNYFKNAIKNAKTIEEWKEVGVGFKHQLTYLGIQDNWKFDKVYLDSNNDLMTSQWVGLTSYGEEKKKKRAPRNRFKGDYVVKTDQGTYLVRNTSRGYKHVYGMRDATRYSEKAAETAMRNREGFIIVPYQP